MAAEKAAGTREGRSQPGAPDRASVTDPGRATGIKTGRFARADRILDGRDYARILRGGRRRSTAALVVVVDRPRSGSSVDSRSRLGITIGRKVGGAVERNRFKRRVREWFRHQRGRLPDGLDVVVIARASAAALTASELAGTLSRLLELDSGQAGVRKRESGGS